MGYDIRQTVLYILVKFFMKSGFHKASSPVSWFVPRFHLKITDQQVIGGRMYFSETASIS